MGMGVAAGAAVRGIDGFERSDFGWGEDDRGIQAARAVAGPGLRRGRLWVNCMMITAARAAMATSLMRQSAVST